MSSARELGQHSNGHGGILPRQKDGFCFGADRSRMRGRRTEKCSIQNSTSHSHTDNSFQSSLCWWSGPAVICHRDSWCPSAGSIMVITVKKKPDKKGREGLLWLTVQGYAVHHGWEGMAAGA